MDREARDPLDLLDEIEKGLALTVAPMVWPIGQGKDFAGTYDLQTPRCASWRRRRRRLRDSGPDDPLIATLITATRWPNGATRSSWCATCATASTARPSSRAICRPFIRLGAQEFGVRDLLEALIAYAPPPRDLQPRPAWCMRPSPR